MAQLHIENLEAETPHVLRTIANMLLNLAGGNACQGKCHDHTEGVLGQAAMAAARQQATNQAVQEVPTVTGARSTAGAGQSETAPAASTELSPTPATASAPVPPAPSSESEKADAAPAPTNLATGVETDARGLPWDHRIHSSNHKCNADGSWLKRRGVEDTLVAQVEAELRRAMAVPTPPAAPVEPSPAVVFAHPAVIPVAGVVPPPPPPVDAAPGVTFPSLMQRISAGVARQAITQQQVIDVIRKVGLDSIPVLAARPDLLPAVSAELQALGV